ncbi:flagellar hook-associated protein FlgK [Kineococcus sp. T13]|uniref:flagellar hook-associated protein FlgK n=1 Tax=Kineococcus vitellinus TaxID=2696565 RepID=UPI001411F6A6|nr:flagellar hook-associated protein FlgK [Kineococcus vitellinus]NAZ74715.1 flagellar hook-associated protein FlgK [Kineococcus vitellinus]
MSTFSGINQAARALNAAQRGMEVTGQNIANANTPGYSRQRVEQTASVLPQTGQHVQKNVAGDGVTVNGITRVADALATATARQDAASAEELATAANVWAGVEAALGDTGTSGLSKDLANLTSAWNDLAKAGTDGLEGARSLVVTRSQAVLDTVTTMDTSIQAQYEQLGLQAQTLATRANTAAENVAKLNKSIRETLASGGSANELMDQRDQVLDQLASITGARSVHRQDGTVDVLVGNATLVTGEFSYGMVVGNTDGGNPQVREGAEYTVTVGGQSTGPVAGSLKATLDGANETLKKQWDNLNAFATKFTDAVNTAYNPTDAVGGDFFTSNGATLTAHDLKIATGLTANPGTLKDSSGLAGAAGGSDRKVAQAVLATFDSTKAAWRTNATTIAASTQSADNRAALASQVSLKSSNARDAVAGVNLDEEMTNLVSYQHAYSAAARVLNAIDEALETLIQRTGV